MPEMADRLLELENVFKDLQECALNKGICEDIVKSFDSDHNIKPEVIERLLELCIQNPKDETHAVLVTTIVSAIVKNVNDGVFTVKPDLTPSMLKLFHMLKTTIYNSKSEGIMVPYFEALLACPGEAYIKLEEKCFTEIKELLCLYMNQKIPKEIRVQPIHILNKYLKVLPPDKRSKVVKEGINIWFLKLIPNVMVFATMPDFEIEIPLETLEIVVKELLCIDYADNPNWQFVLQCIYTPQKYPAVMKNLLEKGSHIWHRLWIVFIKMLKNEITKNNNSVGSPINSMLPVVETAFKMDINNRCRAFSCWNVLIDNFSTETNEVYINKRIKLLLIPLCSNNAKVEETAISKFKTWWHLISSFHTKVKNFSEVILKPFLQFCFGKPVTFLKPVFVPGLLSNRTKEYCIEAFVNILGHHNCEGCVSLPKLSGKLLNNKNFVDNWKDLVYCLNMAIRNTPDGPHNLRQPLKCCWMSFLNVICELPDSNVSRNLFNELLTMLKNLIQGCCEEKLMDIVLNDLIMSLFDGNEKMIKLLKTRDDEMTYIQQINSIMLNPSFELLYNRYDMSDLVAKLKPFANYIVERCIEVPTFIINVLEKMSATYISLVLWTALTSSICEKKYDGENLSKMLLWPLRHMDLFTKVEFCSSLWHTMYELLHATSILHVNDEILELLMCYEDINPTNSLFLLKTSIVLLKRKTSLDIEFECEKETDLMLHIINRVQNLNYNHLMFSSIIDVLSENLRKLSHCVNINIGKKFLSMIKIMFMNILPDFKTGTVVDTELLLNVKEILTCIENILKLEAYACLKETVLIELIECAPYFAQQEALKVSVLAILQMLPIDAIDSNHSSITTLKNVVDSLKNEAVVCLTTTPIDESKVTSPSKVTNKKQKETSIVNTIVENGEEFVVVKSNWKFNPKKLTDKQKEKFQRQRQDIPALYQDLSQSQDEFKLTTWKTDSQDTTTSSSKSNGLCNTVNDEVSSILKNTANKDVVPKILKNILTENKEKSNLSPERSNENVAKTESPVNKEIKTPRIALKDRVFRNVRNLIEKSKVLHEDKEAKSLFNEIMKTPTGMGVKTVNTILNSAPSDINLDRPTRVRRKPKKFEDLQVFTKKKRGHSLGYVDSQIVDSPDDASEEQEFGKKSDDDKQKSQFSEILPGNEINQNTQCSNSSHLDRIDVDTIHDVAYNDVTKNNNNLNEDNNSKQNCKSYLAESDSLKMEIDVHISSVKVESCESSGLPMESFEKNKEMSDPKSDSSDHKLTIKKPRKKKSLIEKELAIDMVEGHPFLKVSEKRLTRKNATEYSSISRRKSVLQKLQTTKTVQTNTQKAAKKSKEKDKSEVKLTNETQKIDMFDGSQDTSEFKNESGSQDIIESSQDSTVSITSTKSTKNVQLIPIVKLQNIGVKPITDKVCEEKNGSIADNNGVNDSVLSNCEIKDDSDIPHNKTATKNDLIDLTDNMDTEPVGSLVSNEIIALNNEETSIVTDNRNIITAEMDTQDIADADTQTLDQDKNFESIVISDTSTEETQRLPLEHSQDIATNRNDNICDTSTSTQDDITKTFSESLICATEKKDDSSSMLPIKDVEKRKLDFLNNTLEISPIKTLSPVRDNKSPSPETSLDYMIVKLSSPVQINGEPFEKLDSPEIFTEDKTSPDKRDQSPPREEIHVTNVSPRSLSIKKNKPQVRTGGRAAQMLGLCVPVPDRLQTIMNSEKSVECEETKKCSSLSMSARRNLRILYNSTNESSETSEENEESDNFLKLKRTVPAADSSPSVPILKRKLSDITDDTSVSPASKRKRVSFHDPPVSTTVCVKKYIDPCGVRSPQNSVAKRQERQLRSQLAVNLKSQKRLDTAFKLEKALTKAIESFGDGDVAPSTDDDTEMSSLEPTPLAEVVMNCELNDKEPVCMELMNCKDSVDNIASELSSPEMKPLLIKEFAGKIETVGDLAKMTELEVNRLCIKMPKVQITKKVLTEYMKKLNKVANEVTPALEDLSAESSFLELKAVDVQTQTDWPETKSVHVHTEPLVISMVSTQTDIVHTAHCTMQTDESDIKSTADIVTSLLEKPNFIECLNKQLDTLSKQCIADNLPINAHMDSFIKKIDQKQLSTVIDRVLEKHTSDSLNGRNNNQQLLFLQDYLIERFSSKDLILFCSDLLRKVVDKNV